MMIGKMLCECGYIHSDTCGYDGYLFKEDEWLVSEEEQNDLDPISVFECPECGNLMIDDATDRTKMITYKPSNGKYNKILHNRMKPNEEIF
jgi:hypothetical protein